MVPFLKRSSLKLGLPEHPCQFQDTEIVDTLTAHSSTQMLLCNVIQQNIGRQIRDMKANAHPLCWRYIAKHHSRFHQGLPHYLSLAPVFDAYNR